MREVLLEIMNVETAETDVGELKVVKTSMFEKAEVEVSHYTLSFRCLLGLTFV